MPFDHEHGQPVRQLLFHYTIRQTGRGGMEQIEIETQAESHGNDQSREA
jgi:hypothetical protein